MMKRAWIATLLAVLMCMAGLAVAEEVATFSYTPISFDYSGQWLTRAKVQALTDEEADAIIDKLELRDVVGDADGLRTAMMIPTGTFIDVEHSTPQFSANLSLIAMQMPNATNEDMASMASLSTIKATYEAGSSAMQFDGWITQPHAVAVEGLNVVQTAYNATIEGSEITQYQGMFVCDGMQYVLTYSAPRGALDADNMAALDAVMQSIRLD